ncbi:hypothetical protein E2C01_056139 [Portunus trituberculatus]|uniref:Uncharacterized protein n=1 Tax=Portunus trituberculatus TaxID=210409 RepID=A0A5B7GX27_PORTR|nr:hypothetical protein [Portunus trituberculatus]
MRDEGKISSSTSRLRKEKKGKKVSRHSEKQVTLKSQRAARRDLNSANEKKFHNTLHFCTLVPLPLVRSKHKNQSANTATPPACSDNARPLHFRRTSSPSAET